MDINNYQMNPLSYKSKALILAAVIGVSACQKTGTVPTAAIPTAFTVVNAIPNSVQVIPVINTSSAIMYFNGAKSIGYGNFYEYSPSGGNDTVYVVQQNSDTVNLGPNATGLMFSNILDMKVGNIYSLFLTGIDTSSPDYLFTADSIPYYPSTDSVTGIRFVNLSTGSSPISINLEGSPNGSEVGSLPYKGITSFKQYVNNSTTRDYFFVIRDAATGDSLTQFDFVQRGGRNIGFGLTDPKNRNQITFKNITIALIGQPGANAAVPQSTMLIDNY